MDMASLTQGRHGGESIRAVVPSEGQASKSDADIGASVEMLEIISQKRRRDAIPDR